MKQWFLMQEQVRWRYVFKLLLMMFIKRAPLGCFKFLTFVALDSDGKPTSVPDVEPETSVEKWFHETAPQRVARRKERRKESIDTIEYLSRVRHIEK